MITSCHRCGKPVKERLITEEYAGMAAHVTVTGIPAAACGYCGHLSVDPSTVEEIEMYMQPLMAGGCGINLLQVPEISIDLGHSIHPSAIDLADPHSLGRLSRANDSLTFAAAHPDAASPAAIPAPVLAGEGIRAA